MRSRLCRVCGGWHGLGDPWPEDCADHFGARAAQAASVISDEMPPVRSGADGKLYTSKSAIRRSYKPSGNPQGIRFVELGNNHADGPGRPTQPDTSAAVHASLERALSRYSAGERPQLHQTERR